MKWALDVREYPEHKGQMGRAYAVYIEAETARGAIEKFMCGRPDSQFTWIAAFDSLAAIDRCVTCHARWTSNFVRLARNVKLGPPDAEGKRYYVVTQQQVVSPHLVIVDGEQVEIARPFEGSFWAREAPIGARLAAL